jgi:CO/xanthine dehydrogenase FAD-binding subunit
MTVAAEAYAAYAAPESLQAALQFAAAGEAVPFVGGTDLMVAINAGHGPAAGALLNLNRVAELRGIEIGADTVRIGATVTVTEILEHDGLAEVTTLLRDTADRFASDQIRNAATIGGNVCNASPAGDLIPPLMALGARVELAHWSGDAIGTRSIAIEDFFTGPGKSVRAANELLTAISFDRPAPGFVAGFEKSGPRPALEIAIVAAALAAMRVGDRLSEVRVALGSVAPTPIRAPKTEAAIAEAPLDAARIAEIGDVAAAEIKPISDVRGSDWYRRHLTKVMIERLIDHALAD